MFFNMLDVAAFAASVIYYENNNMIKKTTNQRRVFLRQLSAELTRPLIEERFTNDQVMHNHSTKTAIEAMLGPQRAPLDPAPKDDEPRDRSGRKKIVGSCHVCYRLLIKGQPTFQFSKIRFFFLFLLSLKPWNSCRNLLFHQKMVECTTFISILMCFFCISNFKRVFLKTLFF